MLNPRLQQLVDDRGARYELVPHPETVTAHEAAQRTHVHGQHVAKAVVVRDGDGVDFLVVVPASVHVDPARVRAVSGRPGVTIEDEAVLGRLFPDCELGAMPPVGHLYGLVTYVDPCLLDDQDTVWFQAGNHHELVGMSVEDFARIARPFHGDACLHEGAHAVR